MGEGSGEGVDPTPHSHTLHFSLTKSSISETVYGVEENLKKKDFCLFFTRGKRKKEKGKKNVFTNSHVPVSRLLFNHTILIARNL